MILSLHTNNNFLSPDEIILYQLQKPEHRIEQTFSALMFLHAGLGYTLFNSVINRLGSNHYNPTRGVTQCHKNASFFYIRCTYM